MSDLCLQVMHRHLYLIVFGINKIPPACVIVSFLPRRKRRGRGVGGGGGGRAQAPQ